MSLRTAPAGCKAGTPGCARVGWTIFPGVSGGVSNPASDQLVVLEEGRSLTCRACGSRHLRRSHPRNALERLGRAVTPLRFHRCSDCGLRGYHLAWIAPPSVHPQRPVRPVPPTAGHRVSRDALGDRIRRRRILFSILIATILGAIVSTMAWPR